MPVQYVMADADEDRDQLRSKPFTFPAKPTKTAEEHDRLAKQLPGCEKADIANQEAIDREYEEARAAYLEWLAPQRRWQAAKIGKYRPSGTDSADRCRHRIRQAIPEDVENVFDNILAAEMKNRRGPHREHAESEYRTARAKEFAAARNQGEAILCSALTAAEKLARLKGIRDGLDKNKRLEFDKGL